MKVYISHGNKYYRVNVSREWVMKHDNGAVLSCGLSCPGDVSEGSLKRLISTGKAVEASFDEWNHSGCLSECTLRGGKQCRW